MIKKFNEFINEGLFKPNKYDEYINDFFEEIKDNFDASNLTYSNNDDEFSYIYDNVKLEIKFDIENSLLISPVYIIHIKNVIINCSNGLKKKIFKFFKKEFNDYKEQVKLNNLKNQLSRTNRTANKYNL